MVSMNQNYQSSLHNALVGRYCCFNKSGDCVVLGTSADSQEKSDISNLQLDKFALTSWESVLHYLVGTSQDNRTPAVVQLLETSGLMVKEKGQLTITSKGFQFLLQDMNVQIWALLLQYLELSQSLQMEPVEVLNFLFQLSSLDFGQVQLYFFIQDYPVDPLTPTQKHMLGDLKCLGLIFQRNVFIM
jgi:transcription initiation factor TFIIH subunit 4